MPQERDNQYPHVTAEEWDKIKAETAPEIVSARALMARNITGVPKRPFLVGDNDHSPIMRGLVEITTELYKRDLDPDLIAMLEDPKL